jgi:hypothetical protein
MRKGRKALRWNLVTDGSGIWDVMDSEPFAGWRVSSCEYVCRDIWTEDVLEFWEVVDEGALGMNGAIVNEGL